MGAPRKKTRPPPPAPAPPPPLGEWLRMGLPEADRAGESGGMSEGARLPKRERLCGRFRIEALFAAGRVGQTRLVAVRAMPSPFPRIRAAFLVGKAFGKAVARGRLRRRLRAMYRQGKHDLSLPPAAADDVRGATLHRGWDLAVIPRRGAAEADAESLGRELALALRRALADAEAAVALARAGEGESGKRADAEGDGGA